MSTLTVTRKITLWRCQQCGHEWQSRKDWQDKRPRICPTCKRETWDQPKAADKTE